MRVGFCLIGGAWAMMLFCSSAYSAVPNALLFNEANCVSGDKYLEGEKSDTTLGRLQGNGQNWLEFIVVQGDSKDGGGFKNTLDLRGWKLDWMYAKNGDPNAHGMGSIMFSQDSLWAAVPRGTLISISEWKDAWYMPGGPSGGFIRNGGYDGYGELKGAPQGESDTVTIGNLLATNTSFNPLVDDWNLHVYAGERNPDTTFKYFSFSGTVTTANGTLEVGVDHAAGLFTGNNDNWQIAIHDADGNPISGPIGEALTSSGGWGGTGVGSDEVAQLQAWEVSSNATQADYLAITGTRYNDSGTSTFDVANAWSTGANHQDLSPLRDWIQLGDTDLDGDVDIDDYNNVQNNFGSGAGGDTDFDHDTDIDDYNNVQNHFGESGGASGSISGGTGLAAVPEPCSWLLAGMGFAGLLIRRARASKSLL